MQPGTRLRPASIVSAAALVWGLVVATVIAASQPPADDTPVCTPGAVSRLYLGQNTPSGRLAESDWRRFVAEAVAPRFPEGFTELHGHGHWRDARGAAVEEATRIVEIAHDDSAQTHALIRGIAADYRMRFAQEAVLITTTRGEQCVDERPMEVARAGEAPPAIVERLASIAAALKVRRLRPA
jgi:hypothetical protein